MEYPRLVFTSPGPNKCNGGTYGHELVSDESEHEAAIKAGFFDSVPEAIEAEKTKPEVSENVDTKPKRGRPPVDKSKVEATDD